MDEKVRTAERPLVGQIISATEAMRLAIHEGARGAGLVAPNPMVGCTIVDKDHRFLAVGYHKRVGADHAEIDAMKQVGSSSALMGCHVYVSLEPCAHQGRTPSCAKALAPLKPAAVTYAVEDPNPLVAGKGAAILREAGVRCESLASRADVSAVDRAELVAEAETLAEIFLHNHRSGELFFAAKVASSLDGKMAMLSGESKWITAELAREHVQLVRAQYDAVLVGRNTFVADDPSLNVRHLRYPDFSNRAVVLDPAGKTLDAIAGSKLGSVRDLASVIVVTSSDVGGAAGAGGAGSGAGAGVSTSTARGFRHLRVPTKGGSFEMPALIWALKEAGLTSVLIEGGAHTFGEFFRARKIQRLHAYVAPLLIGGHQGLSWSKFFGGSKLGESLKLSRIERRELGPDQYWSGRIEY